MGMHERKHRTSFFGNTRGDYAEKFSIGISANAFRCDVLRVENTRHADALIESFTAFAVGAGNERPGKFGEVARGMTIHTNRNRVCEILSAFNSFGSIIDCNGFGLANVW